MIVHPPSFPLFPYTTLFRSDVVADVVSFLRARMEVAVGEGVAPEQIVLDPGPDFAKTPAQTVAVLRSLDAVRDRKSTRLNSSHVEISYAVFCLKKKKKKLET